MARPNGITKQHNEYARLIHNYDRIPKAVLAAIAASFANMFVCEDDLSQVHKAVNAEWAALYAAGIVPQKPIQ